MDNKYNMDGKFNVDDENENNTINEPKNIDTLFDSENEPVHDDNFNNGLFDNYGVNGENSNFNDINENSDSFNDNSSGSYSIDNFGNDSSQNDKDDDIEVLELWEPHPDEITDAKDRHVKWSKKTTNKIVIILVALGALLLMWYAVFAQPIADNNELYRDENWEIGFTDMKELGSSDKKKDRSEYSFTDTSATFHVVLSAPSDEITYELTIENQSDFDAKVSGITVSPAVIGGGIGYEVTGIAVGDRLDAHEKTTMQLKVWYNNDLNTKKIVSQDIMVVVNYAQADI